MGEHGPAAFESGQRQRAGVGDAEVADGAFPVVLFSHGFTGIRVQSSFLMSHLASWGMVVVAPEHPSRDLTNVLGGTAPAQVRAQVARHRARLA